MERIIWLYILILMIGQTAYSQVSISGFISDKNTGEKLINANIYDNDKKIATCSNSFGYYAITIKNNVDYKIRFSYIGYNTQEVLINIKKDTVINIALQSSNIIDEVTVVGVQNRTNKAEMSLVKIPIKQIEAIPMLAGEPDIIKAMQLMPGIKSGHEGQSGMFVRGGSHDQNLVLLDDVPIYNINHLGGFVSVFNTDAINSLELYKGGFPARYGGRLSSIMDIRMKDGNSKKHQANITIGVISSKLQVEGPIKKDTTMFMISGRRFMYDLFTRPITKISDNKTFAYTFYDFNVKLSHKFTDKDRMFFSFYSGKDKILNKKKDKQDEELMKNNANWGNSLVSLRWNHIFGKRFFSNITTSYTKYAYNSQTLIESTSRDESYKLDYSFGSKINDLLFKTDFNILLSNYAFRFGTNHTYHIFNPNTTLLSQTGNSENNNFENTQKYTAFESSFFIENEIRILKNININIGGRINNYVIDNKNYVAPEPRAILSFVIPDFATFNLSYSQMTQFVHLLSYSGAGLPGDLWMPTTKDIPPQNSNIIAVGINKNIGKLKADFSVEAYYKKMNQLIDYKDGTGFTGNNPKNWESLIETGGIGESKGIEFLFQKDYGIIKGWLSYTLSRTTRQFDNINNGNEYLFTYDATHDFSATANYYINEKVYLSATWVYNTGRAITMPNEIIKLVRINNSNIDNIGEIKIEEYTISSALSKNNLRMKPYHRLDVGLSYKRIKKGKERIWNFSIYNAYNRQNAYYYLTVLKNEKDASGNETGKTIRKTYQRSLFPIIPSLSYSIKF